VGLCCVRLGLRCVGLGLRCVGLGLRCVISHEKNNLREELFTLGAGLRYIKQEEIICLFSLRKFTVYNVQCH
jgi:hypothetical protein